MTVSELYHKAFPHYIAMGMTYEEFWEMDCSLVKDYREAKRLRLDEANYVAWLNGLYVYDALCKASPLFRAFSRSGTTAAPYPDKPYEFQRQEKLTPEQEGERKQQAAIAYMDQIADRFNRSFFQKKKQEESEKIDNTTQKGAVEDGRHTNA